MKNNKAKQLVENALTSLTESLERGQSDELKKYLQTMSRFHRYSFRNVLLIALQNPNATRVAGFHTWKKLDRFVKKGENSLVIIAPLVFKKETVENDDNSPNVTEIEIAQPNYLNDQMEQVFRPVPCLLVQNSIKLYLILFANLPFQIQPQK